MRFSLTFDFKRICLEIEYRTIDNMNPKFGGFALEKV